ncbi:MAG: magnesium transporter [Thermoanaerobaculia bacterium]|nr:magnesium transporter [Thermoanaerobaculia bacterium]
MPVPASHPRAEPLARGQRQRLLLRLLRHPGQRQAKRLLARLHPADIAELFALLTPGEQQALLGVLLELRLAARTLRELGSETQRQVFAMTPDGPLASMLGRLTPPDAVDLLREMDEERREAVLALLEPSFAARVRNLMRYGEATAGGLMNPDVSSFSGDLAAGEAVARLRQLAEERRLFYLYVTDERRHLLGIVSLWALVTSASDRLLREIMTRDVVTVRVDMPEEDVAQVFGRYDLLVVPVIDEDGKLVGSISVDDVLDVVEEAATEDLYRLANLDTHETLATPPARSVRLRLPWLLLNLLTAFTAASVVGLFLGTIEKYAILAMFMPIVAGMGGNAGTQTLTLMVRGFALGELDLRKSTSVLLRQMSVGAMNGFLIGLVLALISWLWERNLVLSGILWFASAVNLTVAGLMGAAVPTLLRRLKLDPALGSSIFVTTATDVGGFLAFLGTATLLLGALAR